MVVLMFYTYLYLCSSHYNYLYLWYYLYTITICTNPIFSDILQDLVITQQVLAE